MQQNLPRHIAIIMDGNGRWAERRGLPRIAGHRAGLEAVRRIVKASINHRIEVLSLFAFSSENWLRPKQEVDFLMNLFLSALKREVRKLHKSNVQLKIIGDRKKFPLRLQNSISEAEQLTLNNDGLKLVIGVDYGGCWDITEATRAVAAKVQRGELKTDDITQSLISEHLATGALPDPDLFIRTSGEQRISNFFLMQLAYTEIYFSKALWPDFDERIFAEAIEDFACRTRRYGGTGHTMENVKSA